MLDVLLGIQEMYNRLILYSENREDEIEEYINTGEIAIDEQKKLRTDFTKIVTWPDGNIMSGSMITFKIPPSIDDNIIDTFTQVCEYANFLHAPYPLQNRQK